MEQALHTYMTEEFMQAGQHVHIFRCEVHSATHAESPHTHEFIEIVYIFSGEMCHEINGQEYRAKRGDILFMNPGCTHAFSAERSCSYVNILFAPERIRGDILTSANAASLLFLASFDNMRGETNYGRIGFAGTERKEVEDIVLAMLREYDAKQTSWETVLENYLNTLIVKMLRKVEHGIDAKDWNDVWQALSAYIEAHMDTKLTGDALARKFFYNSSYFSRAFKEKFGMTFTEYIARKRLSYAIELLGSTRLSVDEISRRVGFSDGKGLYRACGHYLGSTPSGYRQQK